jgi:hypothetical protein
VAGVEVPIAAGSSALVFNVECGHFHFLESILCLQSIAGLIAALVSGATASVLTDYIPFFYYKLYYYYVFVVYI